MKTKQRNFFKILVAIMITTVLVVPFFFMDEHLVEKATYVEFLEMLEEGEVVTANIVENDNNFSFTTSDGETLTAPNPETEGFKERLLLEGVNTEVDRNLGESSFSFGNILTLLMFAMIGSSLVINLLSKRDSRVGMVANQKVAKETSRVKTVKFADIAGCDETIRDISGIVDFLKNPEKYTDMGARIPKGVILTGPPGTGKTLLAKAIAGEADVPFFSVSGSDFIEKYVGVGASRVRELFKKARESGKSIIFIDEIDAIGGKRNGNKSTSENEQTINALLTEMDGFAKNEGVIVVAATNRVDMLDEALVRPGRFDRTFSINLPDKKGRSEILKIHGRNKKFDDSVCYDDIASMTIGFSGAALETLLNESAIIAASEEAKFTTRSHIDDAFFNQIMKGNKKNFQNKNSKDVKITAYHEAGHTILAKMGAEQEVSKVTIISTTSGAGGVTFFVPKEGFKSKTDLENEIRTCYAGRAAEEILLGAENITMGASSDIEQATRIIKHYLTAVGMDDDFGLINLDVLNQSSNGMNVSGQDAEIRTKASKLANRLYNETLEFLLANEDVLHKLSNELIEKETLSSLEISNIIDETVLNRQN